VKLFGRAKHGKAHTAAVKAARPLETIQQEYEQVCGAIGEREVRQRVLQIEITQLVQKARELSHEAELAQEKIRADKAQAEKDAAAETAGSAAPA
jgi:hypothetical protein